MHQRYRTFWELPEPRALLNNSKYSLLLVATLQRICSALNRTVHHSDSCYLTLFNTNVLIILSNISLHQQCYSGVFQLSGLRSLLFYMHNLTKPLFKFQVYFFKLTHVTVSSVYSAVLPSTLMCRLAAS